MPANRLYRNGMYWTATGSGTIGGKTFTNGDVVYVTGAADAPYLTEDEVVFNVWNPTVDGFGAGTGFYMDGSGRFSLGTSLTYDGAGTLTITGYRAQDDVDGLIAAGGAALDINTNVTEINGGKITTGSITAAKISVSSLSALSANLGNVTAGTISIGSGNNVFKVDSVGNIWSGNTSFGSASFSVTNTGQLKAVNAQLSGSVAASGLSLFAGDHSLSFDSGGIYMNTFGGGLQVATFFDGDRVKVTGAMSVNGRPCNGVKGGSASGTTSSSGFITFSHGLGTTPAGITVTPSSTNCSQGYISSVSSTQFTYRCFTAAGATVNSQTVGLNWVAST